MTLPSAKVTVWSSTLRRATLLFRSNLILEVCKSEPEASVISSYSEMS